MTAAQGTEQGWIEAWIDGQRAVLRSWSDQQARETTGKTADWMEALRQLLAAQEGLTAEPGTLLLRLWRELLPGGSASTDLWDFPGLGPLKEQQEALQGLYGAIGEYQRLAAEMAAMLLKVHQDTLDLLARRSAELANAGTPVTSERALYDLWVECGEQTYGRLVHGQAYCRLQAALGNAGIHVRAAQQALLERWLKQFDLPTRSELNSLHRRIQSLQNELLRLQQPQEAKPARKPAKRAVRKKRNR